MRRSVVIVTVGVAVSMLSGSALARQDELVPGKPHKIQTVRIVKDHLKYQVVPTAKTGK
jgi:hypothetical protein